MGAMIALLEAELVKSFGSLWIIALIIMIMFIIAALLMGVDLKFAMLFLLPLIMVFTNYGWLPLWTGITFTMIVVGFGGYMMWTSIMRGG